MCESEKYRNMIYSKTMHERYGEREDGNESRISLEATGALDTVQRHRFLAARGETGWTRHHGAARDARHQQMQQQQLRDAYKKRDARDRNQEHRQDENPLHDLLVPPSPYPALLMCGSSLPPNPALLMCGSFAARLQRGTCTDQR